ncbi:MAG TPA: hypothetical protein VI391_07220 [Thermoanaerobaculia bacterium]
MRRFVLLLLAVCLPAFAQQQVKSDYLFHHLAGKWVATGMIGKKHVTHDIDAMPVLKDAYLQLREVSREKDAAGAPQYEAIIFISFDKATGEFTCMWLDSTAGGGLSASGLAHGTPVGNAIPFFFGGLKDGIRNTFTYLPDRDEWTWSIDNLSAEKATPFARLTLARASATQQSSRRRPARR